jgi:hypothetical protein
MIHHDGSSSSSTVHDQLLSLIDDSQMPIFVSDDEDRYLYCNTEMLRVLGRVMSDVIGKTSAQLDGIEAGLGQSDAEQEMEDVRADAFKLKTIIDASGMRHICTARMKTFAQTRSCNGLTVGVLKLEVPLPSFTIVFRPCYFSCVSALIISHASLPPPLSPSVVLFRPNVPTAA